MRVRRALVYLESAYFVNFYSAAENGKHPLGLLSLWILAKSDLLTPTKFYKFCNALVSLLRKGGVFLPSLSNPLLAAYHFFALL